MGGRGGKGEKSAKIVLGAPTLLATIVAFTFNDTSGGAGAMCSLSLLGHKLIILVFARVSPKAFASPAFATPPTSCKIILLNPQTYQCKRFIFQMPINKYRLSSLL